MAITRAKEYFVVGDVPDWVKRQQRAHLRQQFTEHSTFCPINPYDLPKTPLELAIFDFANRGSNRLLSSLGLDQLDLTNDHHHILPPQTFADQLKQNGYHSTKPHAWVDMNCVHALYPRGASRNLTCFAATAIHENLHLKCPVITWGKEDKSGEYAVREIRAGLITITNSGTVTIFGGLEEAVIEAQTMKLFNESLTLPFMSDERDWYYSSKAISARQRIARENSLPADEIYWVDPNNPKRWENFSYFRQRAILDFLCNQIHHDQKRTYQSPDDVFQQIFLRATFTGMSFGVDVALRLAVGMEGLKFIRRMDKDGRRARLETITRHRVEQEQRRISVFVCGSADCRVNAIPATSSY